MKLAAGYRWLCAGASALLLGMFGYRVVRILGNVESVARYYRIDGAFSIFWLLLEGVLFLGPFAVTLSAALALRLPKRTAWKLGFSNACISAFFTFSEGLTCFARMMNGHSGYVGAEPLLSAAVCLISGLTVSCSGRAVSRQSAYCNEMQNNKTYDKIQKGES